jgi:protein ATS1
MLFALGSNGSGQLGLGHHEDMATPQGVPAESLGLDVSSNIRQLAAGGNHTVILSSDGRAFSAGDNSDGRCGTEDREVSSKFREIHALGDQSSQWEDAAATWSATMLVRKGGEEVWVCGSGDSGELGLGDGVREAKHLTKIPDFPPRGTRVMQVMACMAHVVAVLDDGGVYGWGKGRKGQLGDVGADSWTPRRVSGLQFKVERAVCGKDFTCLFGNARDGEVQMLGPDGRDRFNLKSSTPLKVPGWKGVCASWGNVFVLQDNGRLLAWGRDDHGQLPVREMPDVAMVAAGSEHCLALTLDEKVLAWGWGEHGNCGEPTDAKGDVKGKWNELTVSGGVTGIFSGCATSFIMTAQT